MYNSKKEALIDLFDIEGVNEKLPITIGKKVITSEVLIDVLSMDKYAISTELDIAANTAVSLVQRLFPNKSRNNTKVCTWLFSIYELKYCSSCKCVKEVELFSRNSSRSTGYNSFCKECYLESTRDYQREYQKTRKAMKLARVPKWADLGKIKEIYANCPKGHHVDHIIPLQGALVSGLHIENNLQYLTAEDNLKKHNKFEV